MKWSIQQLRKIQKFPYPFTDTVDLKFIVDQVEDILDVYPVNITGTIERINDDTYRFCYHMHAPLVLQCSITLDPVDYVIDEDYDEIYSTIESDDYLPIEKNTIDTVQIVLTNVIVDKPINVSRPDAYEILKERGIKLEDDIPQDINDHLDYYSSGLEDRKEKEDD